MMQPVPYNETERNKRLDEFLTPIELATACIKCFPFERDVHLVWLDVGANSGMWGKAIKYVFPNSIVAGVELLQMEKPPYYDEWITADYMECGFTSVDIVIGNPAYNVKDENGNTVYKAEDFVRNSLKIAPIVGHLLRSNFRHTISRGKGIHTEHHYKESWECTRRPSFYKQDVRTKYFGTKNTNNHDYSFFTWYDTWRKDYGYSKILDWNYKES
jgi:hypothetical protein